MGVMECDRNGCESIIKSVEEDPGQVYSLDGKVMILFHAEGG